jgi:Zn-dependent protease with chaperone function
LRLSGFYFPAGSARASESIALLSPDGKTLTILTGGDRVLAEAPLHRLAASSRLGKLRRKLEFPDGAIFETPDNDAVDALLKGGSGLLHRLEKSWRLALASLLVIVLGATGFLVYGVPVAARWLARATPPSMSRLMTNETLAVMNKGLLRPTDLPSARQQEIGARFRQIAQWEEKRNLHYRLLLRDAPRIGPNAFALPDGRIVMTDQLIAMARNDAEIDGVFAHEMAHVNHAHGLQSVYRASLIPAALAFITGDASQFGQIAAILPGVLVQSAYSRGFEQQADDDAATLLRRHGEDPGRLADLLERMDRKLCGQDGCGPSWLGSHPATKARAARLRRAPGRMTAVPLSR